MNKEKVIEAFAKMYTATVIIEEVMPRGGMKSVRERLEKEGITEDILTKAAEKADNEFGFNDDDDSEVQKVVFEKAAADLVEASKELLELTKEGE